MVSAPLLSPDYHPLIRKLESIFPLTDDERQALLDLRAMARRTRVRAGRRSAQRRATARP